MSNLKEEIHEIEAVLLGKEGRLMRGELLLEWALITRFFRHQLPLPLFRLLSSQLLLLIC